MTNSNEQAIPCQVCNSKIPIVVTQLFSGFKFSCPNCSAVVGIDPGDVEKAKSVYDEFNRMRQEVMAKKI